MGVGMCLYAQLVQTKNKWCKSAIMIQCYHPYLSDFCSRPRLTQPYNHIIYPGVAKNLSSLLLLKVSVVAADITISGKLFHTLTILGAKENLLKSQWYLLFTNFSYIILLLFQVQIHSTIIFRLRFLFEMVQCVTIARIDLILVEIRLTLC